MSSRRTKLADFPTDQLQEGPPFTYCAVDYFRPCYIKKKQKNLKQYVCLFTCLMSQGVDIEVSNTLETDSFSMALRQFINVRGNISQLRSNWSTHLLARKDKYLML